MNRLNVALSLILLVFLSCILDPAALSQATTGLPPFSTVQGSLYDDVKVNDGAVLLTLPTRNKASIIPFSYFLTFNSAIAVTSDLHAIANPYWYPGTSVGLSRSVTAGFAGYKSEQCGSTKGTLLTNYQLIDGFGSVHPIPSIQVPINLPCLPLITTGLASDQSGYSVTTDSNGQNPVIYDSSGSNVTTSTNTLADPNHNTLYYTVACSPSCSASAYNKTFTYTDTTGLVAMTEDQTITEIAGVSQLTQDAHTWTDAATNRQAYTINYSPYSWGTSFGCYVPADYAPTTSYLPSSITAPDGTYTITYESNAGVVTGRISTIVFPSGASLKYTYTGNNNGLTCQLTTPNSNPSPVMVPVLTRTLTDTSGTAHKWVYDTTKIANATVVTDPSNNDTVYTFANTYSATVRSFFETKRQVYQGRYTANNLIETKLICYNGNSSNCATAIVTGPILQKDVYTTPAGMTQSAHSHTTYDNYGNLTEDREYDFTGSLISDRIITYGSYSGGTCTNPIGTGIYNRVCTDITKTGNALISQTNNTYDSNGNLTVSRSSTGGLTSSTTYNSNGTINVATDVNGAQTTYGSNYACNGNFPTLIMEPLGLSRSLTWDCNGGVIDTIVDENNQKTTLTYVNSNTGLADPFYRPVSVTDQANYTTNYTYSPTTFESALNFNGTVSTSDLLFATDGFGHQTLSQIRQGQGSASFDTTQSAYDLNFRPASVSIPCTVGAGSGCTTPTTTTTY